MVDFSETSAIVLCAAGCIFSFIFAIWPTGRLWKAGGTVENVTAVLYLPVVAASFVTTIACGAFGQEAISRYLRCAIFHGARIGIGPTWSIAASTITRRKIVANAGYPACAASSRHGCLPRRGE
nr:hypothetical protein [Rhizobium sp. WYJ-E13]